LATLKLLPCFLLGLPRRKDGRGILFNFWFASSHPWNRNRAFLSFFVFKTFFLGK
jgi:hypothetical protein